MNSFILQYDVADNGMYQLYKDNCYVADMDVTEVDDLIDDIKHFINNNSQLRYDIEIKNDNDGLGIIVDMFDLDECVDTATFWFDDYITE